MSSETLFNRSFLARLPKTKSIASMTLDLPDPLEFSGHDDDGGAKRLWKRAVNPSPTPP